VKGDERGYAMQLTRRITQAELSQWSQGDPISWANRRAPYHLRLTPPLGSDTSPRRRGIRCK
jgi:hypothetical protein